MNLQKLRLGQLKAAGTTVGDVYFPQTKLLLPFNGANAATTTSDLSNTNATVTFNGNSQISTAQSKFGGSSLYFDGTAGDNVTLPAGSAYQFGADFTIETWFYMNALNTYSLLYSSYGGAATGALEIQIRSGISYKIRAWYNSNSAFDSNTSISTGQWYHFALTRSGTTVTYWLNGTSDGTMTLSGQMGRDDQTIKIGADGSSYTFNGYIDDMRVTNGVARYTSTFTPPTTAHLTSAGDVNKQILINSTADGVAIGTGGINQARIAKAWVNFDATQAAASMIRESYNVSSMTDTGTGRYTINFSTALGGTDFVFAGSGGNNTGITNTGRDITQDGTRTASALPIRITHTSNDSIEDSYVGVIVFGN
jgi:hypothetical protein